MSNEKVVQTMIENDVRNIQILTGSATPQFNNNPVDISGNIDAPSRFVEGRKQDFSKSRNHCRVSKTDGKITLVLNEQSTVDKYTIVGKIEVSKKFISLGINNDGMSYTPESLANKFKLLRSIFISNIEHANICATLRNLKANVNRDIEKLNDRKGNVSDIFKQTVESNLPDAITLKIPLLEGEEAVEIKIDIILEAEGGQIKCYLESVEAAELIETQFESRVNQEVEKLKEFVTIIEY